MISMICIVGTAVGAYVMWISSQALNELPEVVTKAKTGLSAEDAELQEGYIAPEDGVIASNRFVNELVYKMDEITVNISDDHSNRVHFLKLKLDLNLFEGRFRSVVAQRKAGVKNAIIEIARQQQLARIASLPGKLYFKEALVAHINAFLNQAAVREIHFSEFYLK